MRSVLATAVVALVAAITPSQALAIGPRADLEFLGEAVVPTGTTFEGTTVGGLSSITFDPQLGVYYVLSVNGLVELLPLNNEFLIASS